MLFVNQTEYGNRRFLRTNVLSARPDLKKYTALRFRQEVKRHPEPGEDGPELVLVFLEAQDIEPPLTLVCSDIHLEMEAYPVEQGAVIEIPLCRQGRGGSDPKTMRLLHSFRERRGAIPAVLAFRCPVQETVGHDSRFRPL